MKLTSVFLFVVILGMVSCDKETTNPAAMPVAFDLAPACAGTYTGTDTYHDYFLATGVDTTIVSPTSVTVSVDPSTINRIVIGADTFSLQMDSTFVTIHPSGSQQIFNDGHFSSDAQHFYLYWHKGSSGMAASNYHIINASR